MEVIAPAHVDSPFNFTIPAATKLSNPLLVLNDATLGYGEPVLTSVRLNLHPGDRIGLLGHNGAGKSTLIKSINGELAMLAGERVAGTNLKIGYFSQHQVDELDLAASALTQLQRRDQRATTQQLRDFLGGFDFRGDKVEVEVATFSGGEKARLALAMIAFGRPNLLLMDEPTNHLDIEMRQALTVALQEFDGAIVLISHDRHLLMNTVDAFLLVEDGSVTQYDGDLDDYRERLLGAGTSAASSPEPKKAPKPPARKTAFRENRQLTSRLKTLETRLERLQRKLAEVNERLADVSLYQDGGNDDLQGLLREQISLKEQISEVEETWLATSEALETGT